MIKIFEILKIINNLLKNNICVYLLKEIILSKYIK